MITIRTKHIKYLNFETPPYTVEGLDELLVAAHEKYDCNIVLQISLPHRPRTTNKDSQNHKIRGDCKAISDQFIKHDPKFTPGFVHAMLKAFAVKAKVYPFIEVGGEIIPLSEADLSVEKASAFIEYIELFADENNLYLIRTDEKGTYRSVGGRTREEMEKYK
jgi:hypothetical protein